MKYCIAALVFTSFLTLAMENPARMSPIQKISLMQSFLLAKNFKVNNNNTVSYPHYQDQTVAYTHEKADACSLLWNAKDTQSAEGPKLVMELYDTLDRTQPLEPQLSQENQLSLQSYLFYTFFARQDFDKNDDIVITPGSARITVTAQQKKALADYRKSLENFLIALSDTTVPVENIVTPKAPQKLDFSGQVCVENYLSSRFAAMDQFSDFINAVRPDVLK